MRDGDYLTVGSPCPRCRSADCWFELGPGDQAGHESVRLHCRQCGAVIKQDVPVDGQGEPVERESC